MRAKLHARAKLSHAVSIDRVALFGAKAASSMLRCSMQVLAETQLLFIFCCGIDVKLEHCE